jgi:hypothetical protein
MHMVYWGRLASERCPGGGVTGRERSTGRRCRSVQLEGGSQGGELRGLPRVGNICAFASGTAAIPLGARPEFASQALLIGNSLRLAMKVGKSYVGWKHHETPSTPPLKTRARRGKACVEGGDDSGMEQVIRESPCRSAQPHHAQPCLANPSVGHFRPLNCNALISRIHAQHSECNVDGQHDFCIGSAKATSKAIKVGVASCRANARRNQHINTPLHAGLSRAAAPCCCALLRVRISRRNAQMRVPVSVPPPERPCSSVSRARE